MVFAHYAEKFLTGTRVSFAHQPLSPLGLRDARSTGSVPVSFTSKRPTLSEVSRSASNGGSQPISVFTQRQPEPPSTNLSKFPTRRGTPPPTSKATSRPASMELSCGVDGWDLDPIKSSRMDDRTANSKYRSTFDEKESHKDTLRFVRETVASMMGQ